MSTDAKATAPKKKAAPKKGYSVIKKEAEAPSQKVYEVTRGGGIIFKLRSETTIRPRANQVRIIVIVLANQAYSKTSKTLMPVVLM